MRRSALLLALLLSTSAAVTPAQGNLQAATQEQPPIAAEEAVAAEAPAAASDPKTTSYGLGLQMGRNFKFQEFDVDLDLLLQGVKDGLAGAQPRYSAEEIQAAIQASQAEAARAIGARNRALGEAFLAANALGPSIYTLPSGLQYEVLRTGQGARPTMADTVLVRFRTSLVDGTVVEDTFGEDQPRTVAMSALIPGWTEALQMMSVGSQWRLFVSPDLAHGDQGSGNIGPGATAVFVIELVDIVPAAAAAPEATEPAPPPADAGSG